MYVCRLFVSGKIFLRMLQLPRKNTNDADLVGPLRKYLQSQSSKGSGGMWSSIFGSGKDKGSTDPHEDALAQFNDLRKRATSSSSSAAVVMKNLAKYFEQISYAESKFPVGDTIRVKFLWSNAFSEKKNKRSLNTLSEEKICILFNMGSVHTELALEADGDALQEKARHFRLAAGIYAAAREFVAEEDMSKMSDLHTETLEMCEALSIASAQTCFYEKAVKAKMSPKTLCKLAMGCKSLFEDALSKAENAKIETRSHWITILTVQRYSFEAAAFYWMAQVEHDIARDTGAGYGIEVARLVEALKLLDQAEKSTSKNKGSYKGEEDVMESVDILRKKIKEMHEASESDNNSVYMESVPDADSLKTIEAKVLVKPIVFDVLNELGSKDHGDDLFRSIVCSNCSLSLSVHLNDTHPSTHIHLSLQVPSVVTEASVEFKSLLEKRVDEMKTAVRESNDMAKGTLASLGLPAALEAEDSGRSIPESTRARLSAIRMTTGGLRGLEDKLSSADRMVKQAEASLGRVRKNLSEEASNDSRYRSKHGSKWTRTRSDLASRQLSDDLKMYEGKTNGAKMANDRIRTRLRSSSSAIRFLSKSDREINAMFPAQSRQRAGSTRERAELKRLLLEISNMIEDRSKKLKGLEEDARKIDIVSIMSKEGALKASAKGTIIRDKDTIFATELSKFDEVTNFLKESTGEKQKELMEQIVSANQTYRKSRDASEATSKREEVLQKIQIALAESEEISEHLREGEAFFQSLNEKIRVLEGTVSDFVLRRRRDAEERAADIEEESTFVTTVPVGARVLDAIPMTSSSSPSYHQQQSVSAPPMTSSYYDNTTTPVKTTTTTLPPPPSYGGISSKIDTYDTPPPSSSSSFSTYDATSTYGYGSSSTSNNSIDGYGSSTYGNSHYSTTSSYGNNGGSRSSSSNTMPPPPSYGSKYVSTTTTSSNTLPPPPSYGGSSSYNQQPPPRAQTSSYDMPPPTYGGRSETTTTTSTLPAYGSSSYSRYAGDSISTSTTSSSSSSSSSSRFSSQLTTLQGMGFNSDQSLRALEKHNGDVDKAVNDLLGSM